MAERTGCTAIWRTVQEQAQRCIPLLQRNRLTDWIQSSTWQNCSRSQLGQFSFHSIHYIQTGSPWKWACFSDTIEQGFSFLSWINMIKFKWRNTFNLYTYMCEIQVIKMKLCMSVMLFEKNRIAISPPIGAFYEFWVLDFQK